LDLYCSCYFCRRCHGCDFLLLRKRSGRKLPAQPEKLGNLEGASSEATTLVEPKGRVEEDLVAPAKTQKTRAADAKAEFVAKVIADARVARKVGRNLGIGRSQGASTKEWDELEEALLQADVGFATTTQLLSRVRERASLDNARGMRELMQEECEHLFSVIPQGPRIPNPFPEKPYVISIVGVNGVGKRQQLGS